MWKNLYFMHTFNNGWQFQLIYLFCEIDQNKFFPQFREKEFVTLSKFRHLRRFSWFLLFSWLHHTTVCSTLLCNTIHTMYQLFFLSSNYIFCEGSFFLQHFFVIKLNTKHRYNTRLSYGIEKLFKPRVQHFYTSAWFKDIFS